MSSDTFFQADHLLRAGDDQAAADAFGRIADAAPEHAAAWRKYTEALQNLGDHDVAARATLEGNAVEANHVAEVGPSLFFHGDARRAKLFLPVH
jgi:ferric-dicitrate binding protein FerR (iron transport regulator)